MNNNNNHNNNNVCQIIYFSNIKYVELIQREDFIFYYESLNPNVGQEIPGRSLKRFLESHRGFMKVLDFLIAVFWIFILIQLVQLIIVFFI